MFVVCNLCVRRKFEMFNPLKRFTTVAKVIVHGAFPLLASVCLLVCARIVLQATVYLPSTTTTTAAQEPPGLGKAAKAPAESRGKPVEGAAAGGSEVSGSKSRSLPSAFRTTHRPLHSHQQLLWRCRVTQLVRQSAPVNSISETVEESARVLDEQLAPGSMSVLGSNQLKKDVDMLSKVIHLEGWVLFGVFSKRDQSYSEMTFTEWEKFCQSLSEPVCRLKLCHYSCLQKVAQTSC